VEQPEEGLKALCERAKELELHLIEVPKADIAGIQLGRVFSLCSLVHI
jgi:hypothetical protein